MGALLALPLHAQFRSEQTLAEAPVALAPDVAAEGSNVYVVWQETSEGRGRIRFRRSTDEGARFEETRPLSADLSDAVSPRLAAAGSDVYVVWEETGPGHEEPDVWFTSSTDGGVNWGAAVNLSDPSPGEASRRPAIAAVGPAVYVVWQELFSTPTAEADVYRVYFRRSLMQGMGASFGDPKLLSPPEGGLAATEPAVAAAGSAVYVAWQEEVAVDGPRKILLVRSLDEGDTFPGPGLNISPGFGVVDSAHPAVAAVGSLVYVAWQRTVVPSPPRAFYRVSTNQAAGFLDSIGIADLFDEPALMPRVAAAGSAVSLVWQERAPDGDIRVRSPSVRGPAPGDIAPAPAVDLSSAGDARRPAVALAGSRIYAVWEGAAPAGARRIVLRRSVARSGLAPANVSETPGLESTMTGVAAAGPDLYVVWSEGSAGGSADVWFRASFEGGRTFSDPVNLSDNPGVSARPRVAAAGQAVYVAWEDNSHDPSAADILFRRSLDRGRTWHPPLGVAPLKLSLIPGVFPAAAHLPTLAAEGSEVYVGWQRDESSDRCATIYGRRSLDQGNTWDPPLDPLSAPTLLSCGRLPPECEKCRAFAPALAAAGPAVHLAFKLYLLGSISLQYCLDRTEKLPACVGITIPTGATLDMGLALEDDGPQLSAVGSSVHAAWIKGEDLRFRSGRTDGEPSWLPALAAEPEVLSMPGSLPRLPTVASAGQEAYVAWMSTGGAARILFRRSRDSGASFELDEKVLSLPQESLVGAPWLAAAGPEVFLTWDENLPPDDLAQEAFLRFSTDEGFSFCAAPDLSIELSGPSDAMIGQPVSYGVKVSGRGCSVLGAIVVVGTPIQLGSVRWCRGTGCVPENQGLLVDTLALGEGEEVFYTLSGIVLPLAAGTLEVTASVVPPAPLPDLAPGDNNAVVTTQILVPPGVSPLCAAIEGAFVEGGTVTYTFVLRNGGPAAQSDNPGPEFLDNLPAGLILIGGSADQGTVTLGVSSVAWDGAIPLGGAVTIRVVAQIGPGTTGTVLCNPGTAFFDLDGDGTNESTRLSDPCCFRVLDVHDIPALDLLGLVLLSALLGAAGLRRRAARPHETP